MMTENTIGVDIAKDHLDVHRLTDGASRSFNNDAAGHKAMIAWIGPDVTRVVHEPTGPYHRAFERTLARAGVPLVKVNPRRARRFAEATGQLAKTDRLDAALLARMGALLELQPRPPRGEIAGELKELHVARQALVKDRTAAKNRGKTHTQPLLKRQNAQRIKQIERHITAIDQAIMASLQADLQLARQLEILLTIPGISSVTACTLLIEMPELGTLDGKQAASLAGLAPITRQSGRWNGRARIQGGRGSLRQALYMPALVAARFNPDLAKKYRQLVAASKPAKVAITAIMRKLIILANTLLRENRNWTPRGA